MALQGSNLKLGGGGGGGEEGGGVEVQLFWHLPHWCRHHAYGQWSYLIQRPRWGETPAVPKGVGEEGVRGGMARFAKTVITLVGDGREWEPVVQHISEGRVRIQELRMQGYGSYT